MTKLNQYSVVFSTGKVIIIYARTKGDAETIGKIKESKENGNVYLITKNKQY
jgi:hypothetical protein